MNRQGMLGRSVRVGLLMACAPSIPWAALALGVAAVELVRGGDTELAARDVRYGGLLIGGGMAAGVLMGLVLAGGLALAPRAVTRTGGLTLAGGLLGLLVFPVEFLVIGAGTDVGLAPLGIAFLAWPVMAVVAAAHSADIVGRTRIRTWLWTAAGDAIR